MDTQKINTLYKILSTKSINTVFQPIVSLKDGKDFITVDLNTPIEKVASLAMERKTEKVYDAIIVTKENLYFFC